MAAQILVSLKRNDRIEGILPYIEEITKPGMKVVFLMPYPLNSWAYLQDHWVTTESPREAMLAGRKIIDTYSWDVQRGLAEQKVFPVREALSRKGVEVAVDVYTGGLKKAATDYMANGDVRLIMIGAGSGLRIMRFLRGAISLLGLSRRPSFSPVLLLHPDHGV